MAEGNAESVKGRPVTYTEDTAVAIAGGGRRPRLNENSDRRAIVNLLIDKQGRMTMREINEHFGFDIRKTVRALIQAGWLEVVE